MGLKTFSVWKHFQPADDTKLGGEVNVSEGKAILQSDLESLEEWASKNYMNKVQSAALRTIWMKSSLKAGICVSKEQHCWNGPGGPGEQAEHESAGHCCNSKGKLGQQLHPQEHYYQRERCDHPTT